MQAALRREDVEPHVTSSLRQIMASDALLLPGVGSFTQATGKMPIAKIAEIVQEGKPMLGICLGLQLFFRESTEGSGRGLALLPGKVKRLPENVKVPQIGWNLLKIKNRSELVEGVKEGGSWVYFVHSYYPQTKGPWVIATTDYGVEYPSVVVQKNLYGTQFHPEKSGVTGRIILRNFLRLVKR